MCGIVGVLGGGNPSDWDSASNAVRRMADRLVARGPDSDGYWFDRQSQVALGHRRLAIVDLSPAGHQPMTAPSGRYTTVFNGEIYNHADLRAKLQARGEAPNWRGQSDTETILACFDAWGIEQTVLACTGMFAIAVWDRDAQQLYLVRDRLGEKPLYYGWQGVGSAAVFLFASELKAIRAHPRFRAEVDRSALSLFLRHNCVPAPFSIFEGIRKLEPGKILTVSLRDRDAQPRTYWSVADAVEQGRARPFTGSRGEAVDQLERLLYASVKRQMVADVPLGAFLSGGVDSSTIVAIMQAQSTKPVKTFTIGFDEDGYDEAVYAKAVAKHLGTDHTELYVPASRALEVIPKLASVYCEPFSDSSQIPTYLVSELARKYVKVSLSGDAGDELFAGYSRYIITQKMWNQISRYPATLRKFLGAAIATLSPDSWNHILKPVRRLLPSLLNVPNIGDRLVKGASVLSFESQEQLYKSLATHWNSGGGIVFPPAGPPADLFDGKFDQLSGIERMMALDTVCYLPDDILVKVDRAAMSVSLETRVPMLDHEIVEFAWTLPLDLKVNKSGSKWVLRQVLERHVPQSLIDRPKMGFGVPLGVWLRTSLRDWAEDLLNDGRLRRDGFFNPSPIRQKWKEHLSGHRNWQYDLWDVLMFQAWLDSNAV